MSLSEGMGEGLEGSKRGGGGAEGGGRELGRGKVAATGGEGAVRASHSTHTCRENRGLAFQISRSWCEKAERNSTRNKLLERDKASGECLLECTDPGNLKKD